MTEDKARKRAIRARMAKTGERYTAARRQMLKPSKEAPLPPRVAEPGMSDEAVKRATGRDWDQWFRALDRWGADQRSHAEIARYVSENFDVDGWWAQTVTVGYERARGMRARHERPDGFSASVSKTLPLDAQRLYAAFTETRTRNRWLEPGTLRTRTSQPGKSARFDGPDGTRVNVYLWPRDGGKTGVQVQVERLADAVTVEATKAFWRERLGRLGEVER
jgi:hypothetical protein